MSIMIQFIIIKIIIFQNYNKSRIHSYRGAKDIEISLDDNLIFEGEIQRYNELLLVIYLSHI